MTRRMYFWFPSEFLSSVRQGSSFTDEKLGDRLEIGRYSSKYIILFVCVMERPRNPTLRFATNTLRTLIVTAIIYHQARHGHIRYRHIAWNHAIWYMRSILIFVVFKTQSPMHQLRGKLERIQTQQYETGKNALDSMIQRFGAILANRTVMDNRRSLLSHGKENKSWKNMWPKRLTI